MEQKDWDELSLSVETELQVSRDRSQSNFADTTEDAGRVIGEVNADMLALCNGVDCVVAASRERQAELDCDEHPHGCVLFGGCANQM